MTQVRERIKAATAKSGSSFRGLRRSADADGA
jgi:hypothetical protein